MLGRWQPWHGGHQKLFEEALKKTGQVNIMVRDVQGVDDNPFDFQTVKNNIEKAYTFAAPNIQAQFSNPEVFGLMVKNGYPIIWRPKSFKFTKFQDLGNKSIQRVLFQSYDGRLETYDYILEKYDDLWKIVGVLTINLAGET